MYYGSVITKKLILFNNSPIASDYMINIDKKMSECVNKSKSLAMALTNCGAKKKDQDSTPGLDSIFKISPQKVSELPYDANVL